MKDIPDFLKEGLDAVMDAIKLLDTNMERVEMLLAEGAGTEEQRAALTEKIAKDRIMKQSMLDQVAAAYAEWHEDNG